MCTALESMGFKQTYSDAAVYIFVRGDLRIILPAFVDDMTFTLTSLPAIKQVIADLHVHFKLCNLGPTTKMNHNHANPFSNNLANTLLC